jgi:hypothetical protein
MNVVMPFNRPYNIDTLSILLSSQSVMWYPICTRDVAEQFPKEQWISPVVVATPPDGVDPCYWKLNRFTEYHDNERYVYLCDDDSFSYGFFDVVKAIDVDVLIVNMKRREKTKFDLIAIPENIRECGVGLEQMIVKGHVMKDRKFIENHPHADGFMIMDVVAAYGPAVVYEQGGCVLWNYLVGE